MSIRKPVRLNDRHEIVDADGNLLIPDLTRFRYGTSGLLNTDMDHVKRQREIGEYICALINDVSAADKDEHILIESRKPGRWDKWKKP